MPDASVSYSDRPSTELERAPDYILKRWQQAKTTMEGLHGRISKYRDLYDFRHYKGSPLALESRIQWTDYTNAVDLACAILSSNKIDFRAYGFTPGEEEGRRASIIEKLLSAAIHVSEIRDEVSIRHLHNLQLARDGVSVIRTVWDDQYHESYLRMLAEPKDDEVDGKPIVAEFTELPLRVQVLDALNFYVTPGGKKRWLAVMYAEDVSITEIEREYDIKLPFATGMPSEQKDVTMYPKIDYWEYVDGFEFIEDEDGNPTMVMGPDGTPVLNDDGEPAYHRRPVLAVRNGLLYKDYMIRPVELVEGYEDIPYTVFFWKPIGNAKPTEWGESLLHALQYVVPHLETRFNRQSRLVDLYTGLPLVSRTEGARKVRMDPGLGKVVQLSLEEELGFPTWSGSPPDVAAQMETLQGKAQESSFPSAMYGQGVRNMAGYAISQMIDSGQIRLTTPIEQLQQGWSVWAVKTLNLVKNFAENAEIHVYGTMRGKFFYDRVVGRQCHGYRIDVRIEAKYPGMQTRQVAEATQARPFMPLRYIHERFLDIQQSDDAIRLMDIEKVKEMPAFQELVMLEYLEELAKGGNEIAGKLYQRYLAQGMPGKPGRPNEPSNPEALPGGSTPIPGTYPVETGGVPPGQEEDRALNELVTASPSLTGQA